jgi:hypothetical protein
MAKAARKNITPRRAASSSRKPKSKSARDPGLISAIRAGTVVVRPGQVDAAAKAHTTNDGAQPPLATYHGEKINHYGNPEEQICDLMRAADLCAYLTADWLTEGRTAPASNSLYIYLPDDFAERLIFVADEVRTRVGALKRFYYANGFETPKPAG